MNNVEKLPHRGLLGALWINQQSLRAEPRISNCFVDKFICNIFPHKSVIIWYLSFSNWLTSFSVIISRSIQVAANGIISFFLWLSNPGVQAGFRKGRGTRDQIANIHCIIEKGRELQKNIYFCFIDYAKAFDYVDHNELWKILQEMGIPDHLTCLLRNLYAGQEATVRHGTTDMEQQLGSK